jgi:hypothetical protein
VETDAATSRRATMTAQDEHRRRSHPAAAMGAAVLPPSRAWTLPGSSQAAVTSSRGASRSADQLYTWWWLAKLATAMVSSAVGEL